MEPKPSLVPEGQLKSPSLWAWRRAAIGSCCAVTLSLAAWALLCCSLGGLLGRFWWMLDLLAHFRVQYLAVAGVLLVLSILLRRWLLLLPVAATLLVNLYLIYPSYVAAPAGKLPAQTLRVMTMNVNSGNRLSQAVRDMISVHEPDVLFVLEYNRFWQEALAPLESIYRYTRQVPQEGNFGLAVYSRRPWAEVEVLTLQGRDVPALEVKLQWADQTWTLVGAHVLPPVSATASRMRNGQLAALAARLASTSAPCVLVGDLNCTPWSIYFRELLETAALSDSSRGYGILGIRGTWPTQLPVLRIPIDHCLVSDGVDVVQRRVTEDYGSDHLALVIDLAARVRTAGR